MKQSGQSQKLYLENPFRFGDVDSALLYRFITAVLAFSDVIVDHLRKFLRRFQKPFSPFFLVGIKSNVFAQKTVDLSAQLGVRQRIHYTGEVFDKIVLVYPRTIFGEQIDRREQNIIGAISR